MSDEARKGEQEKLIMDHRFKGAEGGLCTFQTRWNPFGPSDYCDEVEEQHSKSRLADILDLRQQLHERDEKIARLEKALQPYERLEGERRQRVATDILGSAHQRTCPDRAMSFRGWLNCEKCFIAEFAREISKWDASRFEPLAESQSGEKKGERG